MNVEIELPDKYAEKLDEVAAVEPTIEDQIEVEVLPQVLRLINNAHRQLEQDGRGRPNIQGDASSEENEPE